MFVAQCVLIGYLRKSCPFKLRTADAAVFTSLYSQKPKPLGLPSRSVINLNREKRKERREKSEIKKERGERM
jgi:hypothetical protein